MMIFDGLFVIDKPCLVTLVMIPNVELSIDKPGFGDFR